MVSKSPDGGTASGNSTSSRLICLNGSTPTRSSIRAIKESIDAHLAVVGAAAAAIAELAIGYNKITGIPAEPSINEHLASAGNDSNGVVMGIVHERIGIDRNITIRLGTRHIRAV